MRSPPRAILRARPLALLGAITLAAACSDTTAPPPGGDTGPGVIALYDSSRARSDFFAQPWPSDDRIDLLTSDNKKHLNLAGYNYPGAIIGSYLALFHDEPATGFGTSSAIYFRFDGPIDPATLPPTSADSLDPAAGVFVVDVTPGSPTFGRRSPVRVRFQHEAIEYIEPDWLALLPEAGFPLRERTTYAAVVTDTVRGADGYPVRRDPRFRPLRPLADLPLGVDPAHVAVATIFTTGDFTTVMRDLRAAVYDEAPIPQVADLRFIQSTGRYDLYQGTYEAPNYQEGDPPYAMTGGRIALDANGKPRVVRTETLRFALTVPRGEIPTAGWPVVLYAHGTGGSYMSFVYDGSASSAADAEDAAGTTIAKMAMISIDQVLHGPRDPTASNPELTFYNIQNLLAARDNVKQGALDDFTLLRLVENLNVPAAPSTRAPIRFDPDRIYFKGHSQGGQTGPLFLAFEPKVKAAILSGAGAMLSLALLGKTEPVNIPAVVEALVGEKVDEFHPLLNLIQSFLESADPNNYARYYFREPPAGMTPKSIFHSLGIVDHYTPVPTMKALAVSLGVAPVTPRLLEIAPPGLDVPAWTSPPLDGNVAGGAATGVHCQYQVPTPSSGRQPYDGHFVIFDHPDAVRQSNAFLATHAATGTARLVP